MEYYGLRRRRNIDMSRFQQEHQVTSTEWKAEELELEEGYEEVEEEYENDEEELAITSSTNDIQKLNQVAQSIFMLDGKPFRLKEQIKKQTFSETHVRTTTYLEKNIQQIIRMLQQQNQIESITKFINDSIKHYLATKYSE